MKPSGPPGWWLAKHARTLATQAATWAREEHPQRRVTMLAPKRKRAQYRPGH